MPTVETMDRPMEDLNRRSSDPPTMRPVIVVGTEKELQHHHHHPYALQPLSHSAWYLLLLKLLEGFAYYGIVNTQTNYLMGNYQLDSSKNAAGVMSAVQASSLVSGGSAVACAAPFLGGMLADAILGDYWCILLATMILYVPGLLLIALTTVPDLLGPKFYPISLIIGMLILFPLGAGILQSTISVFGAKQYHPVLQTSMIESYYVHFFMAINVGATLGGIVVPLVAQVNLSWAYSLPLWALAFGIFFLVLGSPRYVRLHPDHRPLQRTLQLLASALTNQQPLERAKKTLGGDYDSAFVEGVQRLLAVIPMSCLTLPFNVVYSQMMTVFVVQGSAMNSFLDLVDSSMMLNVEAIGVLLAGCLADRYLFPFLTRRGIRIPYTYKFAIGTALGGLSIVWAIIVDHWIHAAFADGGKRISVLWQTFHYLLIGAGEIFASVAAYEATFTMAPKEQKGLASAVNIFMVGAFPNILCIFLYHGCSMWFPAVEEHSNLLEAYAQSQVYHYLWVLLVLSAFGVWLNFLPSVQNWVEGLCQRVDEKQTHQTDSETIHLLDAMLASKFDLCDSI